MYFAVSAEPFAWRRSKSVLSFGCIDWRWPELGMRKQTTGLAVDSSLRSYAIFIQMSVSRMKFVTSQICPSDLDCDGPGWAKSQIICS